MVTVTDTVMAITQNKFHLLAAVTLLLIVSACGSSQKLTQALSSEADAAFQSGDYATAVAKYNELTSKEVVLDSVQSRQMAIAANRINDHQTAFAYGTKYAISEGDTTLVLAVAESADSLQNFPISISLTEKNLALFEEKYGSDATYEKLALYYAETSDKKLCQYYDKLTSSSVRSECFDVYFDMAKDSLSVLQQQNLCKKALKDNPQQEKALFVLARTKYESAEEQYKVTMAEYNKKKNATTYAYLRRDLKKISAVYVESKGYFEKLRKIDEENKTYIKYLININLRLDQPDKAKALEKLL